MRTTVRSLLWLALLCFPMLGAADSPYVRISKLASYLSDGETVGVLEAFDRNMKGYGAIAEDVAALAAQTEVLCSIDVVEDKEADDEVSDIHHLDLDWYMMLKSRAEGGPVERRRLRVAVIFERVRGVWRITSLSPEQILAPLTIR